MRRTWIAAAAATLVIRWALPAAAWQEGELLIWINGDKGYRGLAEVGRDFENDLGIKVKVEAPEGVTDKFQQAAQAGKGPDIFFWAHDRLGEWADAGLLSPIDVDDAFKQDYFEKGWNAFMHDGKLWGYPVGMEAVALIYNKELVDDPPGQLGDVPALDAKLKEQDPALMALLWDYNNTYFTWGVLASGGAYVFKDTADGVDVSDVGVNTEGAIQALREIVELIDNGVMPRGASYSVMEAKMNEGELAMMINGPWSWANLRKSGIDFGIAPVPGVQGNPGKPFVGVLGGMINRSTPNADLAVEFLENYLMPVDGVRKVDNDVPVGVPTNKAFFEELAAKNPLIEASMVNVDNGVLMPKVPQMGRFWSAMAAALQQATNGQATPAEALNNAAKNIAQ